MSDPYPTAIIASRFRSVAALAIAIASPVGAQSGDQKEAAPPPRTVIVPGRGSVLVQPYVTTDPKAKPRMVLVPGRGEVYVVPVAPKDRRTPRERCVDREMAEMGASPSPLDQATVDLKCSQR